MTTIDNSGSPSTGLDLYTVHSKHQSSLIQLLEDELSQWQKEEKFVSASIHASTSGERAFVYSQWNGRFDYRVLPKDSRFHEFFPPERHLLEVVVGRPEGQTVAIAPHQFTVHLAEFRLQPQNQTRMIELATLEVDRAMQTQGLVSATFHRSFDGTRVFNYGQWENPEAIERLLKEPGFGEGEPYWQGLAKNEFSLYDVVAVV